MQIFPPGVQGVTGEDGLSAYEIAILEGFVGSEAAWLASLVGDTGATGAQGIPGIDGEDGEDGAQGPTGLTGNTGATGEDGLSAYELAVIDGFEGTEEEWLESLIGPPGTTTWAGITDKPLTFAPIIGAGGGDAVAGNDARLTDTRTPTAHKTSHQDGGSDEISVTGLSGLLADAQTPLSHTHDDRYYTESEADALLAAKQPLDADLTTIAGLTATSDNFMVASSSAWASRTPAQAKTSLALVKGDVGLGNVDNTSDAGKPVSAATQTALDGKAATTQKLDDFGATDDNTDLDASTSKHGLMKKYPGGTTTFLRADGSFAAPTAALPDLIVTALTTAGADRTIASGYGAYIPDSYEIVSGRTFEIASGAVMEIG